MSSGFENILVIDTAMNACCAGIYRAGTKTRTSKADVMTRGHAERLIPLIEEVMKEAGVNYDDLDAIGVTVGPGAFTGLRIGLSAAKALGLSLNIPVFGITTTQALATQYSAEKKPKDNIAVIIETKREDFYFQAFLANGKPMNEPHAVAGNIIEGVFGAYPFVVIGDGAQRLMIMVSKKEKTDDYAFLDTGYLAEMLHYDRGVNIFRHNADPVYLRGADITTSKRPQRVIAK